jgi:hypothetical protein
VQKRKQTMMAWKLGVRINSCRMLLGKLLEKFHVEDEETVVCV